MEEQVAVSGVNRSLLGKGVVIILPIILVVMVVLVVFPEHYYFKVKGGDLLLMSGKIGWLDAHPVLDPIPLGEADAGINALTGEKFKSEATAMGALRMVFSERIKQEQGKLLTLEKELVGPYTKFLRDLEGARAAGVEGLDKNIEVVAGWLEIYQENQSEQTTASEGAGK